MTSRREFICIVPCATLATLAAQVERAGLQSPCLTIVGEVVRLRDQLAWFGEAGSAAATTTTLHTLEA